MFVECAGSVEALRFRTRMNVNAAKANVIMRPRWTPPIKPFEAIKAPPKTGAITIGTLFKIDCNVKPIALCARGRESPITAKIAGDAMLCQAITKARPTNRNGHEGLRR